MIVTVPFIRLAAGEPTAMIVICLVEELVVFLSCEVILGSRLTAKRLAIADLMEIVKAAGNTAIAV